MKTLEQIAAIVDGKIIGASDTPITGVSILDCAEPGDLTFAASIKHAKKLKSTKASAAIVTEDVVVDSIPCVIVDDVQESFCKIAEEFRPPIQRKSIGVHPNAFVSPTAKIGEQTDIYPGAFIGDNTTIGDRTRVFPGACVLENCEIGSDVTIFPNAVLYENTKVGDRSIIHASTSLGAFGFGYNSDAKGHRASVQLGNVEVGTDVEVGAGSTIDRGTYGPTRVGDGTKIDDLVMIGHNCQIGKHNLLCSQVGIAGSCRTGDFVIMAGQVGIGDHIEIGDQVTLGAQSGVMHNLESGQIYLGSPAIPVREQMQVYAIQPKLPKLRKQINQLEKKVAALEPTQKKAA